MATVHQSTASDNYRIENSADGDGAGNTEGGVTRDEIETYERESNHRAGFDPDELETDPVRTMTEEEDE